MRKLATIRRIDNITPIEGADNIELAQVGGWKVVIAKNVEHSINDLVVYCEVDSFLPIQPEFEFLRKSSYKKMGDEEGFRLKTIKLRGQISQGLILPIDILKTKIDFGFGADFYESISDLEGSDVTQILGIKKYEPPIPAQLSGQVEGLFPSYVQKTDEERIQNLKKEYNELLKSEEDLYITEKLDGTSFTASLKDGEFKISSRNLELSKNLENTYWKVAEELDLENKMRKFGNLNFALQGELIGEGIQKNKYKIKGQTIKFFTAFDIDNYKKYPFYKFLNITQVLNLETVPFVKMGIKGNELPPSIEEILKFAEGKSFLNPNTEREGIVVRNHDNTLSFKVISNKFLLKNKE